MSDLEHWSESPFAQQPHLIKCLLLPTRLNEWPNLLWLSHDVILRSFRSFQFLLLVEFHDFYLTKLINSSGDTSLRSRWWLNCWYQSNWCSRWAVRLVTQSPTAVWTLMRNYFKSLFWSVRMCSDRCSILVPNFCSCWLLSWLYIKRVCADVRTLWLRLEEEIWLAWFRIGFFVN